MVLNLVESVSEEVIKVTIKDKPGLRKPQSEEHLRAAFQVLKLYALQERRVRQLRSLLEERGSRRRLRRCLASWREFAAGAKASASREPVKPPKQPQQPQQRPSGEIKIELLVSAIAERQKELMLQIEKPSTPGPALPGKRGVTRPPSKPSPVDLQRRQNQQSVAGGAPEKRAKLAEHHRRRQQQKQEEEKAKLQELDRAARQTSKRTIEVARQALDQCDQRTRRGIIHLMREQGCRDQSVVEIPRVPSPPRFLMRMEARADARKERMRQADEIRRHRREEQKKRDEANRMREEEEQRLQQIKAQKEAAKMRREQELKRLKEIERNRNLEKLADQCYNKYLFRRYIVEPLCGIVDDNRKILNVAQKHYEDNLLGKIFAAWKIEWTEQLQAKSHLADKLYRHNLLWYNFDEWRTLAVSVRQKQQVAVDFYDMNLQKKSFKVWHYLCVKVKIITHAQEVKAKKHYEKHLKKLCFNIWKQYMSVASEINKSEQRRDEWRDLIKKFIPETPKTKKKIYIFIISM
ncbi:trichohyalin [Copidosoma floridanum]|uniref:trichohyalin n=1 Tax=Copidosoma floridanum TaxID=29053 RepID=UPI0006C9729C|nr:trichohyalin [Copidosoma floridanum]